MDVERLFSEEPEFETDRLLLRKLSLHDASDYFDFASDPIVSKQTLWDRHETIDDTIKYLVNVLSKYESRQAYRWGIIYKPLNKLIGRTGLIRWSVPHQSAEIGFAIASEQWNEGIITEATSEIIKYGFEKLDLNRIEGRCNYNNFGSSRVMEKLGMRYEGTLRQQLKIKEQFIDQKVYSIIRDEYLCFS